MILQALYLTCILLSTALNYCDGYEGSKCYIKGDYTIVEKCFDENSLTRITCKPLSFKTGNKNDTELRYVRHGIPCRAPKSQCQCHIDDYEFYIKACKCYDPTPVPEFPKTGVIRWNGTEDYDGWWRKSVKNVKGEVHKASNGDYLRLDHSFKTNVTSFEILISDGVDSFVQYTGNTKDETCKVVKNKPEKALNSVWEKFYSGDPKINLDSFKTEMTGRKKRRTTIQTWKTDEDHYDYIYRWEWKLRKDDNTGKVVPVQHTYRYREAYPDEVMQKNIYDYHFRELKDGENSFQLDEYCQHFV